MEHRHPKRETELHLFVHLAGVFFTERGKGHASFYLITPSLDLVCRRNDLISRGNELLCRRND